MRKINDTMTLRLIKDNKCTKQHNQKGLQSDRLEGHGHGLGQILFSAFIIHF